MDPGIARLRVNLWNMYEHITRCVCFMSCFFFATVKGWKEKVFMFGTEKFVVPLFGVSISSLLTILSNDGAKLKQGVDCGNRKPLEARGFGWTC